MPKRKLEDELEEDWADAKKITTVKPGIKKNSLDSDEEDEGEEKTYDILDEDDIEGQEEGGAGFDGEVQITPFNMREEMEEGHFDTEGNYHWNKEANIKDNWLENIDWVKIKQKDGGKDKDDDDDSDSDDSRPGSPFDHISVYKQLLELMKPGETVAKALRRLGGSKSMSASERWRRKKAGLDTNEGGNQQQVTDLTELANRILNKMGNMDIYQESYEQIRSMIDRAQSKKPQVRMAADYGDALDMYADDFDEKEKARIEQKGSEPEKEEGKDTEENVDRNDLMWEYKVSEDSTEISGPHSTQQMYKWVQEGHFKTPVLVRKSGSEGQFYTSSRVDFDLYL